MYFNDLINFSIDLQKYNLKYHAQFSRFITKYHFLKKTLMPDPFPPSHLHTTGR